MHVCVFVCMYGMYVRSVCTLCIHLSCMYVMYSCVNGVLVCMLCTYIVCYVCLLWFSGMYVFSLIMYDTYASMLCFCARYVGYDIWCMYVHHVCMLRVYVRSVCMLCMCVPKFLCIMYAIYVLCV